MTEEQLDSIKGRLGAVEESLPWSFLGDAIRARDDKQVVIGRGLSGAEAVIVHDAAAIFISSAPDDIATLLAEVERLRLIEAASREFLNLGRHDGECDNKDENGDLTGEACSKHIRAYENRREELCLAFGGWTKGVPVLGKRRAAQ